jgi:hypothetical protein
VTEPRWKRFAVLTARSFILCLVCCFHFQFAGKTDDDAGVGRLRGTAAAARGWQRRRGTAACRSLVNGGGAWTSVAHTGRWQPPAMACSPVH